MNEIALADEVASEFGHAEPARVGVGGGLGTPAAVAAAFAAGAAFVVTGSVNQATVESGLSEDGRALLAQASMTDIAMAPAADMFELGVEVQVLKRGTLFAQRGKELYKAYRSYESLEAMPAEERDALEQKVLGRSIDDIWAETEEFFGQRDREDECVIGVEAGSNARSAISSARTDNSVAAPKTASDSYFRCP